MSNDALPSSAAAVMASQRRSWRQILCASAIAEAVSVRNHHEVGEHRLYFEWAKTACDRLAPASTILDHLWAIHTYRRGHALPTDSELLCTFALSPCAMPAVQLPHRRGPRGRLDGLQTLFAEGCRIMAAKSVWAGEVSCVG